MYMGTEIAGSTHVEASVSARLDRLPPTRYFRGLVARIAVGGWFEFYEMFMPAYISLGLIHSGLYRATTAGLFDVNGFASFLGSFFAGMFVGTAALGGITDRIGRRIVFTFAMLTYSVASIIAAFQHSPLGMDALRFVAGVGIGMQLISRRLGPAHEHGERRARQRHVRTLRRDRRLRTFS
ncbi:hypothetical protein AB4Y44_05520 [Paraburkholderia sp. BR10937]|uniref:hypothetical protein n=1 Tax=Paraburkholderia sp. BR10937 TaxID=3236994 RepID=UPI0034D32BF5